MTDREPLELAYLRSLLDYSPETGLFVWRLSNSNVSPAGSLAGRSVNSDGYRQIVINRRFYKAHRLAWFYVHGVWPDQIDHINGDRTDNRLCNLRNVTSLLNTHNQRKPHCNNRSGFLGVSKRADGRFQAEIRVSGKKRYLGAFATAEQAGAAYVSAKRQMHEGSTL
jgi:hypothetical protein